MSNSYFYVLLGSGIFATEVRINAKRGSTCSGNNRPTVYLNLNLSNSFRLLQQEGIRGVNQCMKRFIEWLWSEGFYHYRMITHDCVTVCKL